MKRLLETTAITVLSATTAFAGVGISSPTSGQTVSSPVQVVASASMSYPVTTMQVYVDGNLSDQKSASSINDAVTVASGTHSLVVQSWDNHGNYAKSGSITVTVSGTSSGGGGSTPAPSGSKVYANVSAISGWSSCGACAGANGHGPTVPYSLSQNVSSPSMDGHAAHFWIGGSTPYGDALWWKELGANANVSHFTYDVYFYYKNAGAVQALEFDTNQNVGGRRYIFGTQCNVAAKQFDVWNTASAYWMHTGIACSAPPTYTWNHLTWEFERVNGQTHFIAVTLNGKKSYVNKYGGSRAAGGGELNVAFQMDEVGSHINYDMWLDKLTLTAW
ncbi:MAG: hypothetical protein P4L40_06490 [Terracidiphilus sp.]|nr:hypothetical protein [Terracidiphilus sp.]